MFLIVFAGVALMVFAGCALLVLHSLFAFVVIVFVVVCVADCVFRCLIFVFGDGSMS